MINEFFTTLYVIKRASWLTDEENNPYSGLVEVDQFMGHIQQAQAELIQSLALSLTTAFTIWCPVDTLVLAGDILESVDGQYSVKAIQKNNVGSNKHLQLIVQYDGVVEGS